MVKCLLCSVSAEEQDTALHFFGRCCAVEST